MWPMIIGAGIGAAGNIIGGLISDSSEEDAAKKASKKDWERQKEVLQNQVQWRVKDATAAGLHPLAALGLSPASGPAPTNVGQSSLGESISAMGANIGRAAEAFVGPEEKLLARAQLQQQMTSNELQNAHLRAQTALLNQQLLKGVPVTGVVGKSDRLGGASQVTRIGFDNTAVPLPPGPSGEDLGWTGEIGQELSGASALAKSMSGPGKSDSLWMNRGRGWEGMFNDAVRLKAWLNSWQIGL